MKMLSVKQPFANLITLKHKLNESRWWNHKSLIYRGDILICSSKKAMKPTVVRSVMTRRQWFEFEEIRKRLNYDIYEPGGIAQCVVTMYDYREMNSFEDEKLAFVKYVNGLKILAFQDIRPVVSFPVKGMLGLLDLPKEYEQQIRFE